MTILKEYPANKLSYSATRDTLHDVAYKFACFYVRRGDVAFQYCATAVMVADIMTKPLPQAKFEFCRSNMGMRHI